MTLIDEDEIGHQSWFNISHMSEGKNISHYQLVNLRNAFMKECYLKVDMRSRLDNSTDYCYSDTESILGGLGATVEAIAGSILNLMVIVALIKNSHIRKEYMTRAIVSLAATDFLFSIVTLPMLAHRYFSHDWPYGATYGNFMCQLYPFFYYGLYMATIWNLVAISAIRCIGVYFPSKLKSKEFKMLCNFIIALAWLLSYIPMLPGLFGAFGLYGLECKTRKCTVINMNPDGTPTSVNPKEKLGSNTVIMAGTCLVVINGLIYYRLWQHSKKVARISNIKDTKRIAKEKQFGKLMLMIMSLFFGTYFPTYLLKKIDPQATKTRTMETILFQIIQSSAVVIDPIIYIVCHEKYRKAIKRVLYAVTCKKISILESDTEFTSTNAIYKSQRVTTMTTPGTLPRSSQKKSIQLNSIVDSVSLKKINK